MRSDTSGAAVLEEPGRSRGLADVFTHRHLLLLIVRKEIQIRYRGSAFGWLWSYVKPLVQFLVFYVALGVFLALNKSIDYYAIYILAGTTIVTFFNEAFSNGTRSLVDNAALIKQTIDATPGLSTTPVDATYLAWIDCRELGVDNPAVFFEQHGVGLSDGKDFGAPGFVRLNFGCSRALLKQGLARIQSAVATLAK